MSRGRHSRPRAHGGGLATFLALALAGGGVALSVTEPSSTALRLCVAGVAIVGAFGLVLTARLQRSTSRAMARAEERLRVLEQRSRDEGGELHRRVIDAVTREGELRFAVELLSAEIALLRGSLDGLAVPVEALATSVPEQRTDGYPATATGAAAVFPPAVDIPLVQRVLAAQESLVGPAVGPAPMVPPAGDLWLPPARPEPVEAPPEHSVPVPWPQVAHTEVRSWVVRELHVTDEAEPVAALTMRILDLTTPPAADQGDEAEDPEPAPVAAWSSYARPA